MIEKPRTYKESFTFASRQRRMKRTASRWQIALIALLLTLVLGSAGQTPRVQAALDNPADVYFEVSASPQSPPALCINQQLKIYVSINKNITKVINEKAYNLPKGAVTGVKVTGSMSKDIGTLESKKPEVSFEDDELVMLQPNGIGQADFLFTAKKAGTTALTFTADVPGAWTGSAVARGKSYAAKKAEITVKVIPCKFKVKTLLKFPVPDLYQISVISDDAVMKGNETGSFTGAATMSWVYSEVFQDCDFSISATDSQVDLAGQLDDDGGQLAVTQNFHPTTVATSICCPVVGCRSASDEGSVDPLIFSIASTGGVVTQTVTGQGVSGLATIVVIPEEDEAVTFNAGSVTVLSSSAWWARLWDGFPWSYSALRALH